MSARKNLKDIRVSYLFPKVWNSKKPWLVLRGGTRSSKTVSVAQCVILWLFTGEIRNGQKIPSGTCAVVRKHKSTIKATVMRDFESQLNTLGLMGYLDVNKTNRTYKFGDRMVEFVGADDEQKLRGFKSNITWLNEANELNWDKEVRQLRYRTSDLMIIDFNPSDPYVWINEELEQKRALTKKDVDIIVSTYKDNPFLERHQISEIEYTEEEDLNYWKVYGLGLYGEVKGLVFPKAEIITKMPTRLKHRAKAMDFGYITDPTTLIDCGTQNGRDLFLDEIFYLKGMTGQDIVTTFRGLGIRRGEPIVADSAEWRLIDDLKSAKFNVIGAEKGPGSVDYGVQLVNQYNLFITERSVNMIRERLKYRYKTNSDGTSTGVPIKGFDHTLDPIRYYATYFLKPRRPIRRSLRGGVA